MLKLCALSCNGRRRVGVQTHLGPVAQVLKIKMWLVNSSSKISYFLLPSRKSANALLGIYWHFKKIKPLIFTFRAKCVSRLFSLQFQNILPIRKVTQFQIYQNMWIISILTYNTQPKYFDSIRFPEIQICYTVRNQILPGQNVKKSISAANLDQICDTRFRD